MRTQYVEGAYSNTVTLKSRLGLTEDHSNGTIRQIIHDLLLVELFDVQYYSDLE